MVTLSEVDPERSARRPKPRARTGLLGPVNVLTRNGKETAWTEVSMDVRKRNRESGRKECIEEDDPVQLEDIKQVRVRGQVQIKILRLYHHIDPSDFSLFFVFFFPKLYLDTWKHRTQSRKALAPACRTRGTHNNNRRSTGHATPDGDDSTLETEILHLKLTTTPLLGSTN